MNYENVKFGRDCQEKLIEGVLLACNAVQETYGPNGANSIVYTNGSIKITKDGYHTVMAVNDPDLFRMMGIKLVQEACKKTADAVGDATSTTAVLIKAIIEHYKDSKFNPQELRKSLNETLDALKQITNKHFNLYDVALVSTNNDSEMATTVTEAFQKVGCDGLVVFEESEEVKDRVDYSEGFRIDRGYASPYFINTSFNTCELNNVRVFISDTKMDEVNKVQDLAAQAVRDKKSLLLIAPEFDSEINVFLSANKDVIQSCTVISPNSRNNREIMLGDMRILLSSKSECDKVIITKDYTTFIGCHDSNQEDIDKRIKDIKSLIDNGNLRDYDLEFHKKRLANFSGGIATIYVGGQTQSEMKERFDRIEDAVCATRAALISGILVGGGLSLKEVSKDDTFGKVLKTPSEILGTYDKTMNELREKGIIEPYLVVKTALENAVSTAIMILTTNVAILDNNYEFMN